jgi:DNA-binding transcriptional LysR family regulator
MLADLDAVEAGLLADASVPTGTVSVWAPTLFGRVFVLPLLARFLADNPASSSTSRCSTATSTWWRRGSTSRSGPGRCGIQA